MNPRVLRRARESAGVSLADAAKVLQLGGVRVIADEMRERMEAGESEPSRFLLLQMVKVYRRSSLTFDLLWPLAEGERGGTSGLCLPAITKKALASLMRLCGTSLCINGWLRKPWWTQEKRSRLHLLPVRESVNRCTT